MISTVNQYMMTTNNVYDFPDFDPQKQLFICKFNEFYKQLQRDALLKGKQKKEFLPSTTSSLKRMQTGIIQSRKHDSTNKRFAQDIIIQQTWQVGLQDQQEWAATYKAGELVNNNVAHSHSTQAGKKDFPRLKS